MSDDFPVYGETFTYFRVAKSPIIPVMIEGSVTKVVRGWGQAISMAPLDLSIDPDFPEERVGFVTVHVDTYRACHIERQS